MTKRQRALHRRLREEAPALYELAVQELSRLPVGCSVMLRLSPRFEPNRALDLCGPSIVVTKTERGLEYVESVPLRKGWVRPRPRLMPRQKAA